MTTRHDLDRLTSDRRLGRPLARVIDADTREVVYDRDGDTPAPTASMLKVLTSITALEMLGPDRRAATRVVAGDRPDRIVLVGGGDVTLSRLPSGSESCYPGAAHLDELALAVRDAQRRRGAPPARSLLLDTSLFSGPLWHESWDEQEERVEDGSVSYLSALQVDGDRADPREAYSPRSDDPALRAGRAFAAELEDIREIGSGTADPNAAVLGEVHSPSVGELIATALPASDNTVMEMLARLSAIECGTGSSFDAIHPAVVAALGRYGCVPDGIRIADGSGLSGENAVPPAYLARLMAQAWHRERHLGVVYDALPVSGEHATGTLAGRFAGASAVVGDAVRAKTGWIAGAYTLSGVVRTRSGRPLSFAIFALGDVRDDARTAIDAFVTGLFELDR